MISLSFLLPQYLSAETGLVYFLGLIALFAGYWIVARMRGRSPREILIHAVKAFVIGYALLLAMRVFPFVGEVSSLLLPGHSDAVLFLLGLIIAHFYLARRRKIDGGSSTVTPASPGADGGLELVDWLLAVLAVIAFGPVWIFAIICGSSGSACGDGGPFTGFIILPFIIVLYILAAAALGLWIVRAVQGKKRFNGQVRVFYLGLIIAWILTQSAIF